MKRTLKTLAFMLPLLLAVITTGCKHDNHDASVKFELNLPESVAKVADLRIVTSTMGNIESQNAGSAYSKVFTGSLDKDASETFLIVSAFLTLKDNYRETIENMSANELNSFYNSCYFSSVLDVEIDDNPSINLRQSDSYTGTPENGSATVEIIIETLEAHSAASSVSRPFFVLNVNKEKSKWSQIYSWDVWCEGKYTPVD